MSEILIYDRKRSDLIELAVIDESASYEVDIIEIHYDPKSKEYVLLTASGCSCWDGDYTEERFKTMKELESKIVNEERKYNPSLMGAKQLVADARKAKRSLKHETNNK